MSRADEGGSLAARTVRGAGWLLGWRLASRLLGIVNTVVLVRLLTPSDFGLVALATSFSFAIDSLSYLGVGEALVRERAVDRVLYDTAFTIGVLRGSITALIIVACAWPAARFFGDARLTSIFLVLGFAIFMSSLGNIGTVDFQRDMAFGKQVQIAFVPRVASIIASVVCAMVWRSYWALVVGMLVARGVGLVFTYVVHPYRPRVTLRAWRRLVGFSFWSWALSLTALVQNRADAIIIGGYLNPTAVGLYSVGREVGGLVSSELLGPITGALFPSFSSARRSGDSVAWVYLRTISVVALLTLPAGAGIALVARPMMLLVFGARWEAAVPLVQVFACAGVFQVGTSIAMVLLMVENLLHISFRAECVSTLLRLTALLVLVPVFGLVGGASGMAGTDLIMEVIYLAITCRRVGLRAHDLALNLWRPALATGVMALVLLAAGLTQPPGGAGAVRSGVLLGATVLAGALVFAATLSAAWLASGRPRGAETYVLALAGQAWRHWFGR